MRVKLKCGCIFSRNEPKWSAMISNVRCTVPHKSAQMRNRLRRLAKKYPKP